MSKAEHSDISIDSLGESEVELLREKLKQKEHIINEKSLIIDSLRQQVKDLHDENEQIENNEQFLQQKVDRLTKDLEEKENEVDSLTRALKDVELAHEKLEKRMEARTGQVQKFAQDLVESKKELEATRILNEQLQHKNEKLTAELEMANSKRRALHELRQEEEERQLQQRQQPIEYKPQLQSLSSALSFPIADEIGEFMDSSSQLSSREAPAHKSCQYHLHKQTRAPQTITKQEPSVRVKQERYDIEFEPEPYEESAPAVAPQPVKQERVVMRHEPVVVERKIPASYRREPTQEEEHAMRVARAQELARRNAKTKPLHQTSYALELDTFDITNFNEHEIKKGNIRPPQRPPPEPPVSPLKKQATFTRRALANCSNTPPTNKGPARRALANCSNTPPVVKRPVYKKAEAFIV